MMASRKRCDFIFVDLELLGDTEEKNQITEPP